MNKLILLVILVAYTAVAKTQPHIENLAFEGAGIRGLAYCGAIHALEEANQIKPIKRIAGTSAGAITALLLSVGYNSKEIEAIIGGTNFRKFNDGGVPLAGGSRRLLKKYGWYKGKKFQQWLEKLVANKTGNGKITFAQLADQYKALYITGTSVSSQKLIVFSAESYPNMPAANAVRISMSIPFYFQAVFMNPDGSIDEKPKKNKQYEIMVDGGTMDNFPVKTFDSSKYTTENVIGLYTNPHTLGLRIDRASQIALDSTDYTQELTQVGINGFGSFMNAYLVLITERLSRQKLTQADFNRSVLIPDGGISPKIRAMSQKEIDLLVKNGYEATKKYLTQTQNAAKPRE
jgi:NTE family protein